MTSESSSRIEFGRVTGVGTDAGPKKEIHAAVVDARIDLYGPSEKQLRSEPDTAPRSAHTDARGCYAIENLEPGY